MDLSQELGTRERDHLFVTGPFKTEAITVQTGQGALRKGTVLGRVRFTVPTTGTAGSNTGNGTITSVTGSKATKIGTYLIKAALLTSGIGVFNVTDPDGAFVGSVQMTAGTSDAFVFKSDAINFTITNGSTDFVTGDSFTIAATGLVPSSASVTGTGNGTMPQLEKRNQIKKGAYRATCITAGTNGGVFSLTDPDGISVGEIRASSFSGTGNGTITEVKAGPKFKRNGAYVISCTTAVTNGGVFTVVDPDGNTIGTTTIPAGAGGAVTFDNEQISFKLTDGSTDFVLADAFTVYWHEGEHIACIIKDGSTDFIVGDYFSFTVAIADDECKIVNSDNTDGSAVPFCVLSQDVDATLEKVMSVGYLTGTFNINQLRFGGNDTFDLHRDNLRMLGIFGQTAIRNPDIALT